MSDTLMIILVVIFFISIAVTFFAILYAVGKHDDAKRMEQTKKNDKITKVEIIAVNNTTITDTKTRASVTKALIGGAVAGLPGFILGAASGSSRSVTRPTGNEYTFLIHYSDRDNEIETVRETSPRFKTLIQKMK